MTAQYLVPERLYGIIGYPLGHSLSPKLHNWAFAQQGLPAAYYRWPLPGDSMAAFMLSLRTLPIHGLSVTIPHKQRVIPNLDGLTEQALQSGAVNTLFWIDGKLYGENTDCTGFAAPISGLSLKPESAVILGAGGACRACIVGLKGLRTSKIWVCARNETKARQVADQLEVDTWPWSARGDLRADLLINATPLGMSGKWADQSAYKSPEELKGFKLVYDLIYNPLETPLVQQAKSAGCQVISGLEMFLHQAAEQYRLWSGTVFDLDQARNLLQAWLSS